MIEKFELSAGFDSFAKQMLEDIFEMSGGFLLDFSNGTLSDLGKLGGSRPS